jgi:hypothetical protein
MRRSQRRCTGPAGGVTLLFALVLLAGCGSATRTVVVQGPPAQSVTVKSGAAASVTSSTATSASTTATSSEAPARVVHLTSFQSPSGNIGCMVFAGATARCDIVHHTWVLPPRPASCPQIVDFGQGLEVGSSGSGRFVCAGDTARDPTAPKLPYGTASQVGDFLCVSRSTGITCTNHAGGHGFTLSVQQDRRF